MSSIDFPQEQLDSLCNEFLTVIELSEFKLLNWGFVDLRSALQTSLLEMVNRLSEKGHILWEEAQQYGVTFDDVLSNLRERKLIFRTTIKGQEAYRSRFAETIRLLSLLRQRFSYDDWQTANRLVSDVRIDLKRRKYPKRNISPDELRSELRKMGALAHYIEAVDCLLKDQPKGEYFNLARFQKDAILQHFRSLHPQKNAHIGDQGMVIGAGTGAGKTKAFYIPAMAEIASTLTATPYVRALAIYPRTELLKDQLAEAFLEARKLDEFLNAHNKPRTISIGAYYGDTPGSARTFLSGSVNWAKTNPKRSTKEGWECPFFSCPDPDCDTRPALVWYKEDVELEKEADDSGEHAILCCPNCGYRTKPNWLLLTRRQMTHNPPDILFTTTEMLNRRMNRVQERALFGVDTPRPPKLLLLDEIHTYEGLSGTHIAYLLRRWRHARRLQHYDNFCCVGLSATLNNAEAFFAKLTGIPLNRIHYIYPEENDMEEEGVEYNVVLKGDPVSGTSLLSTSVQTAMLLGRMLDVSNTEPSRGAYGQKIFAFTDKLDVNNRWFFIEQDAETAKTLSKFRKPLPQDTRDLKQKKQQAGQDWQRCEEIGHKLNAPLRLDITSSQHRGVNPHANLIIATSTLEVGFNDPTVGAVIQHKAPRSMASFLQRKGRAGRLRGMRPWMVVVTSAYGRDRWAFQHAESLFSPTLNDIDLPLDNYYVRKIQAAFALMDWLALQLKNEPDCKYMDIWEVLSSNAKGNEWLQKQRKVVHDLLEDVLDGRMREPLTLYLQQALGIADQNILNSILWDEPRSLLFEVLPTVVRQLESNWQRLKGSEAEPWADTIANYPMPDFVTQNLFSDLKSPEITLHLPPDEVVQKDQRGRQIREQKSREDETLSLLQCLTEFAPGNVSKRYTRPDYKRINKHGQPERVEEAHWLAVPPGEHLEREKLPVSLLAIEYDDMPVLVEASGTSYQLFRPRAYTLQQVPKNVKKTSVAHMLWKSHFTAKQSQPLLQNDDVTFDNTRITLVRRSVWNNFFTAINSYTQVNGNWVEVARLATRVQVSTRYEGEKESRRLWLDFEEGGQLAALGFITYIDALEFQFQPLEVESVMASAAWEELYKNLSPEYFFYKLQQDDSILQEKLSVFEVGWLWQLELSMLVATAVARQCSLKEAAEIIRSQRISLADHTMKVIFQSQQAEDYGEEKVGRLHDKLRELLAKPTIQQALEECERVLWDREDSQLSDWLQQCYASSLGASLFATLTQLAPDIDPDDLVLDIDGNSIWISEMAPGGVGIISRITDILIKKPYDFDLQMLDILQYCDRQQLATQLSTVADLMSQRNQALLDAFAAIREATDLPSQELTRKTLTSILEKYGVSATRELVVALHAKFLRPNSGQDTDDLIARLVQFWRSEEQRLGCAIDLRVIAVAARKIPDIEQRVERILQRINGSTKIDPSQVFNLLQSLLWLPCTDSCPDCIERRHQFQEFVKPSRALLLSRLQPYETFIEYGVPDWNEQLRQELATAYVAQIRCTQDQLDACKQQLLDFLIDPIEVGFLQFFYPVIERITRTGQLWTIEMRIREFAHA